jgi:hypothetical protein
MKGCCLLQHFFIAGLQKILIRPQIIDFYFPVSFTFAPRVYPGFFMLMEFKSSQFASLLVGEQLVNTTRETANP